MKKAYSMIMSLLLGAGMQVMAQTSRARFAYYPKGITNPYFVDVEPLDSLRFTDTNYDIYLQRKSAITDEGKWAISLRVYPEASVKKVRMGLVDGSLTDLQVLDSYAQGKLEGLREDVTWGDWNLFECGEGDYRAVAFGLDEAGNMQSYKFTEPFNIIREWMSSMTAPLMYIVDNSFHYNWGYGSIMHIRDVMGEEITMSVSNYNWYSSWMRNEGMGDMYASTYSVWKYFDNAIEQYSKQINLLNVPNVMQNPKAKVLLGAAHAFRAMHYLDAARMYEFLPNDKTSNINEQGNDVSGLTLPIGYDFEYRADSTKRATRATKAEMAAYIMQDLNRAEELLTSQTTLEEGNVTELPNLAVVSGLKARLHLWNGDYAAAAVAAQKARSLGGKKGSYLTENDWLNPQTGFNTGDPWLWAMSYKPESTLVNTKLLNWVSWCSNQTGFGYTSSGTSIFNLIDKATYDAIPDTDLRKRAFVAPQNHALRGQEQLPDGLYISYFDELTILKFRPAQGELFDHKIAAVVDVPLMRAEEMLFIELEAIARQGNWQQAATMLADFMRQHRDADYRFTATDEEAAISEIIRQKRIEFLGEGINFFDYKRLNLPVTRGYEGTNVSHEFQLNTTTRPAWMNFVLPKRGYNSTLADWNNPDPTACYPSQNY